MRHFFSQCGPWRAAFAHSGFGESYESRSQRGRGANFGVRRPLRYLAHRLDLDDSQVRRLAAVLNALKTEREQAALDERRSVAAIAELVENGVPTLDESRAALEARSTTTERLNEQTAKAVVAIADLLDEDQRKKFSAMLLSDAVRL